MHRPLILAAICLGLLAACQTYPSATRPSGEPLVLRGRVEFPGYRTQATSADIIANATVSLIDGAGVARMAGVTDAEGAFTLYQSTTPFTPAAGELYTLNVTKRVAASNHRFLTLRTVVQRGESSWSSVSGPTVVVNLATTAAVKFDELYADVSPAQLMGVVTGNAITLPVGPHATAELEALKALLTTRLTNNADPAGGLVYSGDVALTDQASIAAIAAYDVIDGDLDIELADGLTTFDLPNLKTVTGFVTVAGYSGNADLADLDGLSQLRSVGTLTIEDNPKLASIQGLGQLTTITDYGLTISGNTVLTSTAGLENLRDLGNNPWGGDVVISDHPALETVAPMPLTRIHGRLTLSRNAKVTSYAGLGLVQTVEGSLNVQDNAALTTVGLAALTTLGESATVSGNAELTSFGLGSLTTTKNLSLHSNHKLTSMAGLEQLTTVNGSLGIGNNNFLTSLDGLSSLTTVTDTLGIEGNSRLTSLTGLTALTSVLDMNIWSNPHLVVNCTAEPISRFNARWSVFGNQTELNCDNM